MMIIFIVSFLLGYTADEPSVLVPAYSIRFTIQNAGIDVSGTMAVADAAIHFDPENLKTSRIVVTAQAASVRTGITIRDEHLTRRDYFDAGRYPLVRLQSRTIKKTGRNRYTGDFDLIIKSITRSVTIPFTRKQQGDTLVYQGAFTVNRLDFGLGEESLITGNIVAVTVEAHVVH
ncbi:YceI family protein [Parachryseolinea silvisoli]|jgi:polyisoprenoid-binding protein YceI|uniref:YceI family protein n=1 Tax=Parachryseolinea silvisoli TaxID=2873601 RepID=UPI002265990B|nr:YceI family protein [Parachryseolinea silvisoli]MCD9018056.1 YceI family protein [Parachryseolinea silvisoli]